MPSMRNPPRHACRPVNRLSVAPTRNRATALAAMEAQALLGAVVAQVESIELAGPYEPWMTTVGHGPIRQPVRLKFA